MASVPIDDNTVKGLLALDDTTSLGIPVKAKTTTGALYVHLDSSDVTQAVSGTVTANLSATDNAVLDSIQTAVELIDDAVYADDADWTDNTSKHALVGGLYQSTPQTVTDGDVAPFEIDVNGNLKVTLATQLDAVNDSIEAVPSSTELAGVTTHVKKYYTSAGAATDGIIWSPAAGKRWYVTDIFIGVSAAATVTLEDDLAAGDSAVWKAELAANSGWSHTFTTPLFSGEDAADLIITTTAGNVYVMCTGYEV